MKPYYEEEGIALYHGECLEIMQALAEEGLTVGAIIADLPYGKTENDWDVLIPPNLLIECYKKLSINNFFILFGDQPFLSLMIVAGIKHFKYEYIWVKEQGTGNLNANKRPLQKHENIAVFYDRMPSYFPQYGKGTPYKIVRQENKNKMFGKTGTKDGYVTNNKGLRYPTSILDFKRDLKDRYNTNQKPEALLEYLILTYTNEGDLVLDNTFGSGTTAVACKKLNRRFVGIELRKEQCDIAIQRLKEVNPLYQKRSKKEKENYEGFNMEDWLEN